MVHHPSAATAALSAPAGAITTFTVFRFPHHRRFWAFRQMGMIGATLAGGPQFVRMLGVGRRFGGLLPDTCRYAMLATWDDAERAEATLHGDHAFARGYTARACEATTTWMRPITSRGSWQGVDPFRPSAPAGEGPIAVLTRAHIHPLAFAPFLAIAGRVERQLLKAEGLEWSLPIGELPLVRPATFSVWSSAAALARFRDGCEAHRRAAGASRSGRWFREELFARFAVLRTSGHRP